MIHSRLSHLLGPKKKKKKKQHLIQHEIHRDFKLSIMDSLPGGRFDDAMYFLSSIFVEFY
jgi:hypothetical protein